MTARGGPGAGFTLTEVLAVLLVLGMASAAAVPALRSVLDPGPADPARELAEVYRRAREAASTRGVTMLVTVDPRAGVWRLFAADGHGDPIDRGALLRGRPRLRIATAGGGPVTARFDPRGRARAPTVSIASDRRVLRVEVEPWTSSVRVR